MYHSLRCVGVCTQLAGWLRRDGAQVPVPVHQVPMLSVVHLASASSWVTSLSIGVVLKTHSLFTELVPRQCTSVANGAFRLIGIFLLLSFVHGPDQSVVKPAGH